MEYSSSFGGSKASNANLNPTSIAVRHDLKADDGKHSAVLTGSFFFGKRDSVTYIYLGVEKFAPRGEQQQRAAPQNVPTIDLPLKLLNWSHLSVQRITSDSLATCCSGRPNVEEERRGEREKESSTDVQENSFADRHNTDDTIRFVNT